MKTRHQENKRKQEIKKNENNKSRRQGNNKTIHP